MLAIEKPFPIVTASLGGIASLAVGFAGSLALLSAIIPGGTAQTPDTGTTKPATVALSSDAEETTAPASPQQFTSSYKTPADEWRMSPTNKPATKSAHKAKSTNAPAQATTTEPAPAPAPVAASPQTPDTPAAGSTPPCHAYSDTVSP